MVTYMFVIAFASLIVVAQYANFDESKQDGTCNCAYILEPAQEHAIGQTPYANPWLVQIFVWIKARRPLLAIIPTLIRFDQ
jgi:hypothetical protein